MHTCAGFFPHAQVPEIVTRESELAEASRKRAALEQNMADKDSSSKWLYLKKHQDTVAQDPLRSQKVGWDAVPLMNIPRIIAAISNPPPPPPPEWGAPGGEGGVKRPQTLHRFRRVVEQSNMAMQLLGRVNDVLGGKRAEGAVPAAAPQAPSHPMPRQPAGPPPVAYPQQPVTQGYPQQPPGQMYPPQMYQQQGYAPQPQAYAPGYAQPAGYPGGYGAPAPFAAPPGTKVTMVQKKIGNKVVMIPAYEVMDQTQQMGGTMGR